MTAHAQSSPETIAERLLACPILACDPVAGSGNSRVLRVTCQDRVVALKLYPDPTEEGRSRLEHETAAAQLLAGRAGAGLLTARLIAVDRVEGAAAFEWIDGSMVGPRDATDLDSLVDFVRRFQQISRRGGQNFALEAIGATLTLSEMARQLHAREERLLSAPGATHELKDFFEAHFIGLHRSAMDEALRAYASLGLDPHASLSREASILSPSDFGFHNVLKLSDGRLALVDLEYFGWDDPVRLLVDVICHPAMNLSRAERIDFLSKAAPLFLDDVEFSMRLRVLAPLIALRWSLIVLNEFIPEMWLRRQQAGNRMDWEEAKRLQLRKATNLVALAEAFLTKGPMCSLP